MLKRSWYLTAAAVGVAVVLVLGSPRAAYSAIWSAEMALAAVMVLWPLTAGVAAMDQVRHVRSGSASLTEGLPRPAAAREALRRGLAPGWATAGGIVGAVLIAMIIAATNGSPVSWRALAGVPAAIIGSLGFAAIGAALGAWTRSWLTPVLIAVGAYGAFAFDAAGVQRLLSFAGATSPAVVSIEVSASAMTRIVVVLAGLLAVGSLAVIARGAQMGARAAVPAATAAVGLLLWQGGLPDQATWQWRDDSTWPCASILESGAEVCLPFDQHRDLSYLAAALGPVTERLAELDGTWNSMRYTTVPVAGSVRIEPPFGIENLDAGELAILIAWAVPKCLDADGHDDVAKQESLTPAALTVAWWAAPGSPPDPYLISSFGLSDEAPTYKDAETAYRELASC